MENARTTDSAAAARRARFGSLPGRIRYEDMVEETSTASKDRAADTYSADRSLIPSSCLALDLGL